MNEEDRSHRVPQAVDPRPDRPAATGRAIERLDEQAALELLAAAPYGRVVFVHGGEPEIRPLSHLVDAGEVIVRTRLGAALCEAVRHADGLKTTFEADAVDLERREGWSVIVSGAAAPVADPARKARYMELLRTMLASADDTVIAIRPKTVTGIRIVPVPAPIPGQR